VTLGASDYDALLLGLGAVLRVDALELFGEVTSDVLIGAGTGASPVRAAIGVRVPLIADLLSLHAAAEVGLGGRLPVDTAGALAPIEPRFALVVALVLAPRTHAATPVVPPPTERGTHGRILDPSGTPIAHAIVRPAGQTTPSTTTDTNGDFSLPDVPPGTPLEVVADGYAPGRIVAGEPQGEGLVLQRSVPAGALRGMVRSSDGRPLSARVTVTPGDLTAQADADGVFELAVPPGRYTVVIEASGRETQTRHVDVEQGGVTVLNVDLRRGH